MHIETGQYYLAQDGQSVVCAVGPAVVIMERCLPGPLRYMGRAMGLTCAVPAALAEGVRDDWAIAVIRGGHGDQDYRGAGHKPEERFPLIGPGMLQRCSSGADADPEGAAKMMGLFPAKKASVQWEKTGKELEDVVSGDFLRTENGSICVSAMSAKMKPAKEEEIALLGDFTALVVSGGIGQEHAEPEGRPGTQVALNVWGNLAGRYKAMAESADDDAQVQYIRAIREDMRPVCIVRPVVTDPEAN